MFLVGAAMFAMWFFLTLYLQQVLGYSPLVTGFTFLPQTAAIAVGATMAGRLVPKFGPRPLIVAGGLLAAGGLYWLSFISATGTYWTSAFGGGVLCTLGDGPGLHPHHGGRHRRGAQTGGRTGVRRVEHQPPDRCLGRAGRTLHPGRQPDRRGRARAHGHPRGGPDGHDRWIRPAASRWAPSSPSGQWALPSSSRPLPGLRSRWCRARCRESWPLTWRPRAKGFRPDRRGPPPGRCPNGLAAYVQPATKLRRTVRCGLSSLVSTNTTDCQVPSWTVPSNTGRTIDGLTNTGSRWSAPWPVEPCRCR